MNTGTQIANQHGAGRSNALMGQQYFPNTDDQRVVVQVITHKVRIRVQIHRRPLVVSGAKVDYRREVIALHKSRQYFNTVTILAVRATQ